MTMMTPRRSAAAEAEAEVKQKQQKQLAQRSGFDAPPSGERRFVPNEVLLNIAGELSTTALDAMARRHRLTRLELRDFTLTRRRLARLRINDGRPVATVIRSLQTEMRILAAQPNYLYARSRARQPAAGPPNTRSANCGLSEAHALAKGESVRVAVIDTTIDAKHPDLAGADRGHVRRDRRARQAASPRDRHRQRDRGARQAHRRRALGEDARRQCVRVARLERDRA